MRTLFNFKASLLVASMLVMSAAHAATISKDDYNVGKTRISADYKNRQGGLRLAGRQRERHLCRASQSQGKGGQCRAEIRLFR